jgi:hypothetical protein
MKNPLGIHALVWAGSWNEEHREKAIAQVPSMDMI